MNLKDEKKILNISLNKWEDLNNKFNAEFIFGHTQQFKFIDMPTTQENITDYKSHCFDKGEHLDIYGVTKEAKWIKDVIY